MPESGVIRFGVHETKKDIKGDFEYNFGISAQDAIEKFGADVVHNKFRQSAVISAQTAARRSLAAGKNIAETQEILNTWKPGIGAIRAKKDPVAALAMAISGLSPEEKAKKRVELEALLAEMD